MMDLYNTVVDRKKTKKDKTRDDREVTFLKSSQARVTRGTKLFKKGSVGEVLGVSTAEFTPGKTRKAGRRFLLADGERQEWIDEKKLEAVK